MATRKHADDGFGGLSLGEIDADPDNVEESPYSLFEAAIQDLEDRKVQWRLERPKEDLYPEPTSYTSLGWALIDHYDNALQHWTHMAEVEGELKARLIPLTEQLSHIKAKLKRSGLEPYQIELNQEYIECNAQIVRYRTSLELIAPKKTQLHRKMALMSRAVGSLEKEAGGQRRAGNMGRAPRGSSGGLSGNL